MNNFYFIYIDQQKQQEKKTDWHLTGKALDDSVSIESMAENENQKPIEFIKCEPTFYKFDDNCISNEENGTYIYININFIYFPMENLFLN